MKIKSLIALTVFAAVPAFGFLPANADDYTCDSGPCIVKADRVGNYKVRLVWSGQGNSYDYYKLVVQPHGGGDSKEYKLHGGDGGKKTVNLKHEGDYEITLFGCENGQSECERSSEKVRINLY